MPEITAYSADYLPLLGQLMNQMKLPQLINEIVAKPNTQTRLDTGTMVAGMILNLLSDSKIRLYRMYHYFEDTSAWMLPQRRRLRVGGLEHPHRCFSLSII